jgi:hypothetical protein
MHHIEILKRVLYLLIHVIYEVRSQARNSVFELAL